MQDFFISYTGTDLDYATWVAEVLEDSGYKVTIQAWDFKAGDNFVSKINSALQECEKLIVILSNNYLKSKWCEAEWTSKFAEQIRLHERRIIPIRIENVVNLNGLLSQIVYIDIVDKSEEEAKREIINGIKGDIERRSMGFPAYYNLEHLMIDIDYFVKDESITYIKTCTSKMLIGGKNKIHGRITWFVDENINLESLTKGVTIECLNLHDTNLNYNVVFDHELKKGEEVTFKIKATMSNTNRHFDNFFSTEVITPIKNLNINLTIADQTVKKIYTQKLSSSPMNVRTEQPEEHLFYSPFHWHIPNPEINFEYKIYWEKDEMN